MRLLPLLTAALALALASPAGAQHVGRDGYRTDVPAVLSPPRPPPRPPESPFQSAYRRAGFPRMVLFFNREIADTATSGVVVQRREGVTLTDDERVQGQAQSRPGSPGAPGASTGSGGTAGDKFETLPAQAEGQPPEGEPSQRSIDLQAQRRVQVERTTEVSVARPTTGARQAPVPEAQQWLFESGFNNRLAAEGARLVDRAAAMRVASTLRLDDPQRLETAAIRGLAEVAVVVRAAPLDGSARGGDVQGLIFRVTAIDTRNGQLLADDVVPPPPGGAGASLAMAVGEASAAALVTRLIQRWAPRP